MSTATSSLPRDSRMILGNGLDGGLEEPARLEWKKIHGPALVSPWMVGYTEVIHKRGFQEIIW